jgi:hypothetical protein
MIESIEFVKRAFFNCERFVDACKILYIEWVMIAYIKGTVQNISSLCMCCKNEELPAGQPSINLLRLVLIHPNLFLCNISITFLLDVGAIGQTTCRVTQKLLQGVLMHFN